MENASKALIIAGAILLSILLIGLGMMVYSKAKGTLDDTGIDDVAVQTFNSKFSDYEGTNVSGASVNALLTTIVNNNRTYSGNDTSKQVTVTLTGVTVTAGTDPAGKAPTTTLKVPTGYTYTVTSEADAGRGYINAITIVRNGTKN